MQVLISTTTLTDVKQFVIESTESFLIIILILLVTFLLARGVRKLVDRSFNRASKYIKTDPTQYRFLRHFLSGLVYILGLSLAIYMIPSLRSLSVSMFAGAGVLAIIVGFASQEAFANIVSGIFIAIFKPFRVGDRVKIGKDIHGHVEDITLRHTAIKTFENNRIIIPNSTINKEIIENESIGDQRMCKWVDIGISYDSDIGKAMKIIRQEAEKHPLCIDNRSEEDKKDGQPMVNVRVAGFGDSSVNLRAYVWTPDARSGFVLKCDLNRSIKEQFDKRGIEIPFPYRTLVFKDKKRR